LDLILHLSSAKDVVHVFMELTGTAWLWRMDFTASAKSPTNKPLTGLFCLGDTLYHSLFTIRSLPFA
jgi:hypothetical protein